MDGLNAAFSSGIPSFYPADLLLGMLCGVLLQLAVYVRCKNAKKYRSGI